MRPDVALDLGGSADTFARLVWPALGPIICGGEYAPVESTASSGMRRDLDVLAGIDGWQICREQGCMRGIASRVQWGDRAWNTFTIRYRRSSGADTEYVKRLRALRGGDDWLAPALTVQAYVTRDRRRLLSACATRTHDLYSYAAHWLPFEPCDELYEQCNGRDANVFLVVPWDRLEAHGVKAWTWREPS